MKFNSFKRKNENYVSYKVRLSKEVLDKIRNYSMREDIDFDSATNQLITKGYEYYGLEKLYGDRVNDRIIWDRRYYFLTVESRYLYYKLRVRELIDELKSQTMQLSGLISKLELCYRTCLSKGKVRDEELKELERMKKEVERYLKEFLLVRGDSVAEDEYVDDEEVISSIEETLKRYKELFKKADEGK